MAQITSSETSLTVCIHYQEQSKTIKPQTIGANIQEH